VGYAGTTTAGIARAAGVTQPLVHHHFGSKEGLWRAAMDVVFSKMPRLPETAGDDVGARETLLRMVEQFVRFVAEHPEATRIVAREGAAPSPRLDYLLNATCTSPFGGSSTSCAPRRRRASSRGTSGRSCASS
jgi:AcrR family transcriptional regulator